MNEQQSKTLLLVCFKEVLPTTYIDTGVQHHQKIVDIVDMLENGLVGVSGHLEACQAAAQRAIGLW